MRLNKKRVLVFFGGLNLLAIASLTLLLSGCATTQSKIENAKKEIVVRNLLLQDKLEEKKNFTTKEVTIYDLMKKELASAKSDPRKPANRSFISTFTNEAMALNPTLSLRKYTTTLLSSKTGEQATYTTTFPILNLNLSSYLGTKTYIKMKYLDVVIEKEARKTGSSHYIQGIIRRMNGGYGHWSIFIQNMRAAKFNEYFSFLEQSTYRGIALYNLSSSSAKISTMVYYLQHNEFNKLDKILVKEQKKILRKEADRLNKKRITNIRGSLVNYKNMSLEDLDKYNPRFMKLYFNLLPKELISQRKEEINLRIKTLLKRAKKDELSNGYDILQTYNTNAELMNSLNIAIFNSGLKHPDAFFYSTNSHTCLEAGINFLLNYGITNAKKMVLQNLAYNVGVMQKLKCKEMDKFMFLLKERMK